MKESFHLVSPPPPDWIQSMRWTVPKRDDRYFSPSLPHPNSVTTPDSSAYLLINEARRKWEQLQAIKQDVFQGSLGKEGNVPSITLGTP